jgi:hypothetical protein
VSRTCSSRHRRRTSSHIIRESMDVMLILRTNERTNTTVATAAAARPTKTTLLPRRVLVIQRMLIRHRNQVTLLRVNTRILLHGEMVVAATRHHDRHTTKSPHGTIHRMSTTGTNLAPRTMAAPAATMAITAAVADLRTRVVFRNGTVSCIWVPRHWRLPLGTDSALVRGKLSWSCA